MRAHPEGCDSENTKIWPYCLAGAGFGLQLGELAFGANYHEAFDIWRDYARREYLHLDVEEPRAMVTFYYDFIIAEHLEVPAAVGGSIRPSILRPRRRAKCWEIARAPR